MIALYFFSTTIHSISKFIYHNEIANSFTFKYERILFIAYSWLILFNFSVSDFTHALSKAHEQHAEDLSALVEDFRNKNVELRRDQ